MKKSVYLTFFLTVIILASCSKSKNEVAYTPTVIISFLNVGDSGIVNMPKGAVDYTAKINVRSNGTALRLFEIYEADARTGARGALIENSAISFANFQASVEQDHTITGLTENRAIKVVVTDTTGNVFEKNLVVKITPSVIFSDAVKIETVENYYGPYFATWLSGRVYMRSHEQYKDQIDLSLGGIQVGQDTLPHLVNPAVRGTYNLLTIAGLQNTKFETTTYTKAQFDGITRVNESLITSLADPQKDTVRIENNKIYLFKTASGKKGLISISSLTKKTGTIEISNGNWVPNSSYYEAVIATKTVSQ